MASSIGCRPAKRRAAVARATSRKRVAGPADSHPNVQFVVVDPSGACETIGLLPAVAHKIPHLQTILTTMVGECSTSGTTHDIVLPEGCTSAAFVSLCRRVDADQHHLEPVWRVSSAAEAMQLLCTADFLLLEGLLPELATLCKAQLRTREDTEALSALKMPHAVVQEVVSEVRRGVLLSVLTLDDMLSVLQGVCASPRVSSVQTVLVRTWLRQGERTDDEVSAVCASLHHDLWFSPPERVSFRGYSRALKPGAADLLRSLSHHAAERDTRFRPIMLALFKSVPKELPSRQADHESAQEPVAHDPHALKQFLDAVFEPLTGARRLTPTELGVLLPLSAASPFAEVSAEMLPPLLKGANEESQLIILNCMFASAGWGPRITVEMLQTMTLSTRLWAVRRLLPHLGNPDAVAQGVPEYIGRALEAGEL